MMPKFRTEYENMLIVKLFNKLRKNMNFNGITIRKVNTPDGKK